VGEAAKDTAILNQKKKKGEKPELLRQRKGLNSKREGGKKIVDATRLNRGGTGVSRGKGGRLRNQGGDDLAPKKITLERKTPRPVPEEKIYRPKSSGPEKGKKKRLTCSKKQSKVKEKVVCPRKGKKKSRYAYGKERRPFDS